MVLVKTDGLLESGEDAGHLLVGQEAGESEAAVRIGGAVFLGADSLAFSCGRTRN